jgi:hypothetical protein
MFGVYPWMQFNVDDAIAKWTGRSILQEAKRPGSYPTLLSIGGMALTGAILGAGIAPIACTVPTLAFGCVVADLAQRPVRAHEDWQAVRRRQPRSSDGPEARGTLQEEGNIHLPLPHVPQNRNPRRVLGAVSARR